MVSRYFHRRNQRLKRLMLNDQEAEELGQLWNELFYVAREPPSIRRLLLNKLEFATQNRPDLVKR